MGILSLCADSGRPPGLTTHHERINGSHTIFGCSTTMHHQWITVSNLWTAPVTSYYNSTRASSPFPPTNLLASTQSSLHVISDLIPHGTSPPPPHPSASSRSHTLAQDCLVPTFKSFQVIGIFIPLLCATVTVYLYIAWPRRRQQSRNHKAPKTKPLRQHYPLAKPPGQQTKYGTTPIQCWNMVYDRQQDEILTWTQGRIRIYR
jgi:hypothetical protein